MILQQKLRWYVYMKHLEADYETLNLDSFTEYFQTYKN